ncbi:Tse2 family ADP-ribosyltransferase toxin [Acetobacter thailandicus]
MNEPVCLAFKKGTYISHDVKIYNNHSDHYMIVPVKTMPFSKFIGYLGEIAAKCLKIR